LKERRNLFSISERNESMRKAKVAAITMGMVASCLFGGYAVADAATVTLDESITGTPENPQPISEGKLLRKAAEEVTAPAQAKDNKKIAVHKTENQKIAESAAPEQNTAFALAEAQQIYTQNKVDAAAEFAEAEENIIQDVPATTETPAETTTEAPVKRIFVKSTTVAPKVEVSEVQQTTQPEVILVAEETAPEAETITTEATATEETTTVTEETSTSADSATTAYETTSTPKTSVQTGDSISYTVIVLLLASASIVIFSYKRKDNKLE
jgi:hypothetical protein